MKLYVVLLIMLTLTAKQLEAARLLTQKQFTRILLYGGSRSGKTFLTCAWLDHRAKQYAGSRHIIFRRTYADAKASVWGQTLEPLLKQQGHLVKIYRQPVMAEYRNGSVIEVGGLHPSEIDKHLGKEYGTIYTNEISETSYAHIPMLLSRLNATNVDVRGGRIVPKWVADENPPTTNHWSYKFFILKLNPDSGMPRADADKIVAMQINPHDNVANLGEGYLATLEAMSPRDRQRFLLGEFGQTKGLVYDNFDPELHLFDRVEIKPDWPRYTAIDFGFTHPFVHLWAAYDTSNETLYIYREHYQTGMTTPDHAKIINRLSAGETYVARIADHDAGDREILRQHGINTIPADKDVKTGIGVVYDLFHRNKIRISRDCKHLINELYAYRWKDNPTAKDREPVKEDDHALDALRYLCMHVYTKRAAHAEVITWGY
jgi:phage terminase large subunit